MKHILPAIIVIFFVNMHRGYAQRKMEYLDRGLVAVKVDQGVFVAWRIFTEEYNNVCFHVYRDGQRINTEPVTVASDYLDTEGLLTSEYHVMPVINGMESRLSKPAGVWEQNYLDIPVTAPDGGTTPAGESYTYSANDCSVGDLDGDGQYEIILKWDPSNSKDNSYDGYTGNVYLDAYKTDGKFLWRIDLGKNIRAGAHYTQFMVYDLDNDGKAEMACKTAPGTKDGTGSFLSKGIAAADDDSRDYRYSSGYILTGPEYLTIFNGETGAERTTVNYVPLRGTVSSWGDSYGNRVDRFLACVAYLDGINPSLVMCRGYYARTVLVAWDYNNSVLTQRWIFDSNNGYSSYVGQGNHNLSVADVDQDGKDEIVYGAMCVDDDGKGLWNTGMGHGDAMHVSDIDPAREGLEVWKITEPETTSGSQLVDAKTGAIIWKTPVADVTRGVSGNVTDVFPGMECWGGTEGLRTATGTYAGTAPSSANHLIWWDADLVRELLDETAITKYNGSVLLNADNCASNNSSKANPCLTADIFGDWREEVIWRDSDNKFLRIFINTELTSHRLYTLMQDPQYRLSIVWQNVAYNQPPHTGFFIGSGMDPLPVPVFEYNAPDLCHESLIRPWNILDIGNVKVPGCATLDSTGLFILNTSGQKIGGTTDAATVIFQNMVGDGEINANLVGFGDTNDSTSKFGITFRESVISGSKHVTLTYNNKYGLIYQSRKSINGSTSTIVKSIETMPCWVKIKRAGNEFTLYYSKNGDSWIKFTATTVEMENIVMAGLIASSENNNIVSSCYMKDVELIGNITGSALWECWKDIGGSRIEDLTENPGFPDSASFFSYLSSLELPAVNWADNYGTRIRGYITPPESNYYTFYIAGNDSAELWLGPDTSQTGATLIAFVPGSTSFREWNKYPRQTSDSIYLEYGKKYYLEVLHKEGSGDDNLSVAWSKGKEEKEVISSKYIYPYWHEVADTFTGISVIAKQDFIMYPNPAADVIHIELENLPVSGLSIVQIIDISGKVLIEEKLKGNYLTIPVSSLHKGIYIVRIYQNVSSTYQKLIIN